VERPRPACVVPFLKVVSRFFPQPVQPLRCYAPGLFAGVGLGVAAGELSGEGEGSAAGVATGVGAGVAAGGGFTGAEGRLEVELPAGVLGGAVSVPAALRRAATNASADCGVCTAPVKMVLKSTMRP
jgi:hypothetical protein